MISFLLIMTVILYGIEILSYTDSKRRGAREKNAGGKISFSRSFFQSLDFQRSEYFFRKFNFHLGRLVSAVGFQLNVFFEKKT